MCQWPFWPRSRHPETFLVCPLHLQKPTVVSAELDRRNYCHQVNWAWDLLAQSIAYSSPAGLPLPSASSWCQIISYEWSHPLGGNPVYLISNHRQWFSCRDLHPISSYFWWAYTQVDTLALRADLVAKASWPVLQARQVLKYLSRIHGYLVKRWRKK